MVGSCVEILTEVYCKYTCNAWAVEGLFQFKKFKHSIKLDLWLLKCTLAGSGKAFNPLSVKARPHITFHVIRNGGWLRLGIGSGRTKMSMIATWVGGCIAHSFVRLFVLLSFVAPWVLSVLQIETKQPLCRCLRPRHRQTDRPKDRQTNDACEI